ncbi:hypothetical protein [Peterkaempfera sp. SMS 1(5)a]|uniref:hypothetical protein n=1 Tax=Peterkaempfera podocarpi TaxID=3232308 RepID=UPI00366F3002
MKFTIMLSGAPWWVAASPLLGIPLGLCVRRSWTTVDATGITICWGLGRRGHTIPWSDIRSIEVGRARRGPSGEVLSVRVLRLKGRRRTLSSPVSSSLHPDPDFDTKVERIMEWWRHAQRIA